MIETWCDIHAHARPIHYVDSTVACLSHQEIIEHKNHFHYYSVGIHPWWIENLDSKKILELKAHVDFLARSPHAVAIGETGLDRLYKQTWDQQLELFLWHRDLAEQLGKPLVIHKVRSGSDFLGIMKNKRPKTPWIFHDYNGTADEVSHLLKLHPDCYFSFGESILHRPALVEVLQTLELDKILIETDEESQFQLQHYYEKLAQIKSVEIILAERQITQNFLKLLKKP